MEEWVLNIYIMRHSTYPAFADGTQYPLTSWPSGRIDAEKTLQQDEISTWEAAGFERRDQRRCWFKAGINSVSRPDDILT